MPTPQVSRPRDGPGPVPEQQRSLLRVWAEDAQLAELCSANGLSRDDFVRRRHMVEQLEMFLTPVRSIRSLEWFPNVVTVRVMQQEIACIEGLDGMASLESLWLTENRIGRIEGLRGCTSLRELYLNGNRISRIEGLSTLQQLETLWLADNRLTSLEGLEQLQSLQTLNVAGNRLSSVGGSLDANVSLRHLNVAANLIGSFRDIARLASLPSLQRVNLSDPHWGSNPVCSLCNYQTYTLYHLGHLSVVDSTPVTDEARRAAEATFVKKQMYYSMRIKTMRRNASNLVKAAQQAKQAKCGELSLSFNVLVRLARELEREIAEARHLPPVPGAAAPPLPAFESKLRVVEDSAARRQRTLAEAEAEFQTMQRSIETATQHSAARLTLELQTGGNIRMEEGRSTDVWHQSCVDLVRSRFVGADFEQFGIRDVDVLSVTRIHNRHLRGRFEDRLSQVVDTGTTAYKRMLEYLFVGEDPDMCGEIAGAVEDGFRSSSEYERLRRDAGVPLTNSVLIAEQARLLDARDRGVLAAAPDKHPGSKRGQWIGAPHFMLICKAFLGKTVQERDGKAREGATERLILPPSAPAAAKVRRGDYYGDVDCVYRPRGLDSGASKQRVWFCFEPALVLPEYLVELQYVPAVSPRSLSPSSAGEEMAALRALLPPGSDIDMHGMPRLVQHYLSFVRRCGALDSGESDLPCDVLSCVPAPRQRPKIAEVDEAVLRQVCRVDDVADITYLNLFGNHIRALPDLQALTKLRTVVLSFNEIEAICGLQGLPHLMTLDLSFNVIKRVGGLSQLPSLTRLQLNNNLIHRVDDLSTLRQGAPALAHLSLQCNAVCELKSYRAAVLRRLPGLRELDGCPVGPADIRAAQQAVSGSLPASVVLAHARTRPCCAPLLPAPLRLPQQKDGSGDAADPHDKEARLAQVTEVSLERLGVRRIQGLQLCTALRRLSLIDNEIGKIEGLDACVSLEELSLEDNCITRIEHLGSLRCLRRLDLGKNRLTRIEGLGGLPQLVQLSVEDNEIASLRGIEAASGLMELYVGNNRLEAVREVLQLRSVPKLIIVDLSGNPLCNADDYRLHTVYSLKRLKVLDGDAVEAAETQRARDMFVGRLGQELLDERVGDADHKTIPKLNLSGCGLRELGLLERCPALSHLRADGNALTDLAGLSTLSLLVTLNLDSNRLGAAPDPSSVGRALQRLCKLESLSLESNQIVSVSALGLRLPALRSLSLRGNDVTRLDGVEGLPQLRELDVSRNKLRTCDDRSLAQCAELRELWLQENCLRTLDWVRNLTRLQRLGLSQNRLSDLHELSRLAGLDRVREFSAAGNLVAKRSMYRLTVVQLLPACVIVDGQTVTQREREQAAAPPSHPTPPPGRPASAQGRSSLASSVPPPRPSWQSGGSEGVGAVRGSRASLSSRHSLVAAGSHSHFRAALC